MAETTSKDSIPISDFKLDETGAVGMPIVRSLVEYELEGFVSVDNNDGAVVDITVPVD